MSPRNQSTSRTLSPAALLVMLHGSEAELEAAAVTSATLAAVSQVARLASTTTAAVSAALIVFTVSLCVSLSSLSSLPSLSLVTACPRSGLGHARPPTAVSRPGSARHSCGPLAAPRLSAGAGHRAAAARTLAHRLFLRLVLAL